MDGLTVTDAAAQSGWSARMLRYLESVGLIVPPRTSGGFRVYRPFELNRLRALAELRERFGLGIDDVAFAARLRREPFLRTALDAWLAAAEVAPAGGKAPWVEWEQRKHERLLAA